MRIFVIILFCLFMGGCVPTTNLTLVNNSGTDLILSLKRNFNSKDTSQSYVSLEKYCLVENHQYSTLQTQGANCTLLIETKTGEKYTYHFQTKENGLLHAVMYAVIMPDLSLQVVDSLTELPASPGNSQRILPISFSQ